MESKWKDVLAVARALMERGSLNAEDVAKVILAGRSRRARKQGR
jgi:hypothetical protein